MNKHLKIFLIISLTILVIACLGSCADTRTESPSIEPSPQVESTPQVEGTPQVIVTPESEAPAILTPETPQVLLEGEIYLTVSEITLSVVGESENIYVGNLPCEVINWGSNDESVISIDNGVITAVGVGETIVFAEYGDIRVEVKAGCLASTQEELETLGMAILRSPKRIPPIVDNPPLEFFDDVVMVGDSITHIMFGYENTSNLLGNVTFLTRGGSGINGFVRYYWNIFYRGTEMKLEEALALTGKKKAIFMLGQNDLGYRTVDQTFESWDILLERISISCPDMEIYLQSCVPEWIDPNESNEKNEKIDEYNIRLKAYAEENGYHFIDVAPYAEDHLNRMPDSYNLDGGIHLNQPGCEAWMYLLRAYAQWQN